MTTPAEKNDGLHPEFKVELTGRNVEVPEHFAERVHAKLAKVARLDPTLNYFHVELKHEPNPRRAERADKIEITASGTGHIARAEANEDSFYAALETALARMERSLRKVKARRKISRSGHRTPLPMDQAVAKMHEQMEKEGTVVADQYDVDPYADKVEDIVPGQIVRTKEHPSTPMSVEDALGEMEAVGHDFYLFVNEENSRPSVVYRRHAFDYGLITLVES